MADPQRISGAERDIDQAITALKKGAYLLKYGRRGKPKFCPFRISTDETAIIWYYGKQEKQLELRQVLKIIPGQRTAIFQRYPRPEKEYQSFSLIYGDRSLDLICKDKEEAEVWFVGLKALISRNSCRNLRNDSRSDSISSDSPRSRRTNPSVSHLDQGEVQPQSRLGKAFSDIITLTAAAKNQSQAEPVGSSLLSLSSIATDNSNGRSSAAETVRISSSSAVSSSSHGSGNDDFDALGDVLIWGEGVGDGLLGGGTHRVSHSSSTKMDALLPKSLDSTVLLDVQGIACGAAHAVLVSKQGEIYSWGEESGGRLGHGVEADVSQPKLVDILAGLNIELVACGEFHTCAVTFSGDLYTWGDGCHNSGLLGHGSQASHWIPKKVTGLMEGINVTYISCGPWHTALVTVSGELFTFGDGTFGALGHGDYSSVGIPKEVESLKGSHTLRVACGVWHTAAIVDVMDEPSSESCDRSSNGKLFTWGDGDKGRLGHGDKECRSVPACIDTLVDVNFSQVACGNDLTVALTTSGRVYTMGSTLFGQLGSSLADGKTPVCVEGKISDSCIEEIACGSYHVAVLTSKSEVFTWGKGANGQLGHGDCNNRNTPTRVDFLKDKQVKSLSCGANFTAVIFLHKLVTPAENSVCSGCHNPFNFRRKRHNCYNCGLVFCKSCSSRKALKASLAPSMNKPYRVCDDCFNKLKKAAESGSVHIPTVRSAAKLNKISEGAENEMAGPQLQPQFSRLSSFDSFNLAAGRMSRLTMREDLNDSSVLPPVNGNGQRGSISSSKGSSARSGQSRNLFSISLPVSRMVSRSASPTSKKSTSFKSETPTSIDVHTSEDILDDSTPRNERLREEVETLREQVKDLTFKSKLLEEDLERTSRQLKEATELAADEAEKCNAAKEVIKSLTAQLKERIEKVPEGHVTNNLESVSRHMSGDLHIAPNAYNVMSIISSKSVSNINSSDSNGTKSQNEKAERVVQDEPGVYITLCSLPGGRNELKRVRFSRKRFTEEQAEKWWAENGVGVCERHNILTVE